MALTFHVPDMTCGHCVSTITKAISAKYPNAQVTADVETHILKVDGVNDSGALIHLIKEEGYSPTAH